MSFRDLYVHGSLNKVAKNICSYVTQSRGASLMLSSCNESVADSITSILLSQDDLLVIAIEKYIQRCKNQKLLYSINNTYADGLHA